MTSLSVTKPPEDCLELSLVLNQPVHWSWESTEPGDQAKPIL